MANVYLTIAQAPPKDTETGKYKYEIVTQTEGISQEEIYKRAKEWMLRTLKTSDNMVSFDDESKSSLISTGNIFLESQGGWCAWNQITLNFKISIYCKEGRYKTIIESFIHNAIVNCGTTSSNSSTPLEDLRQSKQGKRSLEDADNKIQAMLKEIETTIKSGNIGGVDDDW